MVNLHIIVKNDIYIYTLENLRIQMIFQILKEHIWPWINQCSCRKNQVWEACVWTCNRPGRERGWGWGSGTISQAGGVGRLHISQERVAECGLLAAGNYFRSRRAVSRNRRVTCVVGLGHSDANQRRLGRTFLHSRVWSGSWGVGTHALWLEEQWGSKVALSPIPVKSDGGSKDPEQCWWSLEEPISH